MSKQHLQHLQRRNRTDFEEDAPITSRAGRRALDRAMRAAKRNADKQKRRER